jgi:hypothetical protein
MTSPDPYYYNVRLAGISNADGNLLLNGLFNVWNAKGAATKARFVFSSPQTRISVKNLVPSLGIMVLNSDATLSCGTGLVVGDGNRWLNMLDRTRTYTPDYVY